MSYTGNLSLPSAIFSRDHSTSPFPVLLIMFLFVCLFVFVFLMPHYVTLSVYTVHIEFEFLL